MLSLSGCPLPIRFLSSASLPVPATQPSVSSFPTFPVLPHSGFPGAPSPLSLPWLSPFFQNPVSRVFFPGSCTRLSVRFLSSFPVSLPQPFHRCFPYAFAFGLSPRSKLSFVRCRSVLTTQPSALSFPFFPFSPGGGSHGAYFPLPSGLLPCRPSDSGTQLSAIPFSVRCFASQKLPQRPDPYGRFPLAHALGAGYSAFKLSFQGVLFAHPPDASEANLSIIPHDF